VPPPQVRADRPPAPRPDPRPRPPPQAPLREKAAALRKVADGWDVQDGAAFGLLRPRSRNTVAAWLNRSPQRGRAGLKARAGRGRKPASFSRGPDPAGRPQAAP
jgi:hypothetical protein